MNISDKVLAIEEDVIKWRRDLHQIPEIGLDLPKTTDYVRNILDQIGIEYEDKVDGAGILGFIEGGKPGRTIALRADMDGLPIEEDTGLKFESKNNNMHACGHDAHTAILLGAAKLLYQDRDKLNGNIKLIFQPAEEGPGGAKPMLDEGIFENPKVDAVFGLHVGNLEEEKSGSIVIKKGPMMASLDEFKVRLIGKGCHGAYPETGIDPVTMSADYVNMVQKIVSREVSPNIPAVITIGTINGGRAYNIIPDYVELTGTVRTVSQDVREMIDSRLEKIARSVSESYGGSYEYEYKYGYPPLINDDNFVDFFLESAGKILPKENIVIKDQPAMGGEDFAFYLNEVPGAFCFLQNPLAIDGVKYPHHNAKFALDEDYFKLGVELMYQTAVDYLK